MGKWDIHWKSKFNAKCYNCSKHGHRASEYKDKSNFEGKCSNCNKKGHKSYECKKKHKNLVEQIVKAIFGWNYNTWCRCHYCGEFGHIGENFIKNTQGKEILQRDVLFV